MSEVVGWNYGTKFTFTDMLFVRVKIFLQYEHFLIKNSQTKTKLRIRTLKHFHEK